jgi:hypothetical protein
VLGRVFTGMYESLLYGLWAVSGKQLVQLVVG